MAKSKTHGIFSYSEEVASLLQWKCNGHRHKAGDEVTPWIDRNGYQVISVLRGKFFVHRVIYEIHHGEIDAGLYVDHIDGDVSNNKIENLRLASSCENSWNRRKQSNGNPIMPKGISYKSDGTYVAAIQKHGKRYFKYSKNLDPLISWLSGMREELHGEYANHGA